MAALTALSLGTLLNPLKAVTGSDVVEAAEALTRAAAGAVADVAPEVVEGVVVVAGIPEEVVFIAGVAVVVGGTYLLGQAAASGTSLGDYSDDPYVVPPADGTKPDKTPTEQPPHPTKPIVTGTKTTQSTTAWQTTTKWFDDTYLYTRTDSYSYTTTRQWTYYDNGTTAYRWWNSPTKHTWKIDAQPLIDLGRTVKVYTDAAAKPTAPQINGSAPEGGRCGSGGTPGSCLPRGGALPQGTTNTPQTAIAGNGGGSGKGRKPKGANGGCDRAPAGPDVDPLTNFSDSMRGRAGQKSVQYASEYTSPSGEVYYCTNQHGLSSAEFQKLLDDAGLKTRGCAEIGCLIDAFNNEGEAGIRGGSMRTQFVKSVVSETADLHATAASPCAMCQDVLNHFGISF